MNAPGPGSAERAYVRTLVIAAILGVPVAAAALVFASVLHGLTHAIWTSLPHDAGWDEPPWWYVLLVPAVGGALVAAAIRWLPGHGGHRALDGLSLEPAPPIGVLSILAASLASLAFGMVLGPEAPIMAIGLTLGVVTARLTRADQTQTRLIVLAGVFGAMSTILGGPLPSTLLLLELMASSGAIPSQSLGRAIVPGLLAAGTGTLLFTGVHNWKGVHEATLAVGLPDYPTVQAADVAWSVPLAAVTGVVVALARPVAHRLAAVTSRRVVPGLLAGGLAVGLLAVLFRAITDRPVDLVLFSGQTALAPTVAEGSAGVLVAIVAFKAIAYVVSLGSGFRGGPIFPTVAIGAALGGAASIALPGVAPTPAIVAGIAAGAAAGFRLPIFGAVLAALLAGPSFADVAPIAILAAAIGWLVSLAVDRATAPAEATPA